MGSTVETVKVEPNQKPDAPAGKRRLLIIVAAVGLLAIIVVPAVLFSGILPHQRHDAAASQLAALTEKPLLMDVPDIITNLDSGSRRAIFVRLKAKIEVAHASDQAVITANMPRILDAFQTYLRSMRPEELHGGEGTYRLREALMNRIDVIATPVLVLDVLFVEMLIQ